MPFYVEKEIEIEIDEQDLGIHDASDWLLAADLDLSDVVDFYDVSELLAAVADKIGMVDVLRLLDPTPAQVVEALGATVTQTNLETVREYLKGCGSVLTCDAIATFARVRENEIRQEALDEARQERAALREHVNTQREQINELNTRLMNLQRE